MTTRSPKKSDSLDRPRVLRTLLILFLIFVASLMLARWRPNLAPWIGMLDGLAVGIGLGAAGLVRSYDESWDEFWETTAQVYLIGPLSLLHYWFRKETPSAFFWVGLAAELMSYIMLCFVPPLIWLAADLMLFFGTFVGWLLSGFFRPEYY
jgi:hypothetical protein